MAPVFFIDFEGFQHGREDIQIKELVVLDHDQPSLPLYFLFDTSIMANNNDEYEKIWKTYNYQTSRLHHLEFTEGHTHYCASCIFHHIISNFPNCANGLFYVLDHVNGNKVRKLRRDFPQLRFVNYSRPTMDSLPLEPNGVYCPC